MFLHDKRLRNFFYRNWTLDTLSSSSQLLSLLSVDTYGGSSSSSENEEIPFRFSYFRLYGAGCLYLGLMFSQKMMDLQMIGLTFFSFFIDSMWAVLKGDKLTKVADLARKLDSCWIFEISLKENLDLRDYLFVAAPLESRIAGAVRNVHL